MAEVRRPVIFLQMLAARAVEAGGNSLITVLRPVHKCKVVITRSTVVHSIYSSFAGRDYVRKYFDVQNRAFLYYFMRDFYHLSTEY